MKIELKNVKTHEAMSEETTCFSASIYLEGKRIGVVRNRGCGGPNEYTWTDNTAGRKVEAWAETQETDYEFEKLDQIIDDLMMKAEEKKQLRRYCKKQTLFVLAGDQDGSFRTIDHPFTPEVKSFLDRKHGEKLERIVNEEL
jgi:hypothetical protein